MKKTMYICIIFIFLLVLSSNKPAFNIQLKKNNLNSVENIAKPSNTNFRNRLAHFGVTIYDEEKCCNGYTLIGILPLNSETNILNSIFDIHSNALLIDMEGSEINKWEVYPHPAKLLPGGSIISGVDQNPGRWDVNNITQFDWDGNIEWNFCNWDIDEEGNNIARSHHDFQREGNPVGYYAPEQDFVEHGKTLILAHKTTHNLSISYRTLYYDDVIYEVNWNGTLTGFEWLASDHLNEMGFNLISRIGLWLNPGGPGKGILCPSGDPFHINSVSYLGENRWYDLGYEEFNPNNIIISSRHANFLAIIDKDTGSIVWKVGPYYKKNNEENKLGQIIGLHHAHMIPKGLPGAGNILLFDNGGCAGYGLFGNPSQIRRYSRIIEFNPITLDIVWQYYHTNGFPFLSGEYHKFFTPSLGSVQRLPNGNTLISEGLSRRSFEVTPDKEIVWEYFIKIGTTPYRVYRVPPEWVPENPSNYSSWNKMPY